MDFIVHGIAKSWIGERFSLSLYKNKKRRNLSSDWIFGIAELF